MIMAWGWWHTRVARAAVFGREEDFRDMEGENKGVGIFAPVSTNVTT
jgi:hypothetical protein